MDLDRYLATNRPSWDRLKVLSTGGPRKVRKLSDSEMDELVSLYQRVSTHLSYTRTYFHDPALTAYLTQLVATAGSSIYGSRALTWRNFGRFFTTTFPAAVWHSRRALLVSFVLVMAPAFVAGAWIANSPSAVDAAAPPAVREAYINHDFEDYYESQRASQFSSHVFTNNVQVAILAFGGGVAFCIPTVVLLVTNGANVGFAAGLFTYVGQSDRFYGLITPHGLLEMTSVIIAGAAGLRLGWSVISPGDRKRSESLAEEGKRAVVIVFGLVPAFAVAGFIEGYVTGQPWPTYLRVGIGVVVELAFLAYLVTQGRSAAIEGKTGALGEEDARGWLRPSADDPAPNLGRKALP